MRRLLLGSALMLFLELALIRWLGANIVHLSYFSNFVLLGSFLGIGLGFLIARKTLVGAAGRAGHPGRAGDRHVPVPVTIDRAGQRRHLLHLAAHVSGPPAWLVLPVIFVLVAAVLAGPAEVVGRCFGAAAAADGLPLGPDRLADRHRLVHRCCRSCGRRPWSGASLVGARRSCC